MSPTSVYGGGRVYSLQTPYRLLTVLVEWICSRYCSEVDEGESDITEE